MTLKDFQLDNNKLDTRILKKGDADRDLLSKRIKYIIDNYDVFEELIEGSLDEHFDAYTEDFCRCYYLKGMTRNFFCYSEWFQAIWRKMGLIGEDPLKAYWNTRNCLGLLCQLLNQITNPKFDLRVRNHAFIRDFIDVLFYSVRDKVHANNGDPSPIKELWFMDDFSF